jgi:Uri superfamily endonuclease
MRGVGVTSVPGTYILVIVLAEEACIRVGALGPLRFAGGTYLYVGSAMSGLQARLRRHLRRDKRLHWHIDYLLAQARIATIWYHPGPERFECAWARALAALPGLSPFTVRRFGASDCSCPTHLFHASAPPDRASLVDALAGIQLEEMRDEPDDA